MVYVTSTPAADAKSGLGWTTHCIVLLKSDKSSHQGLHTQVLHLQSSVPMFDYKCYVGLQVFQCLMLLNLVNIINTANSSLLWVSFKLLGRFARQRRMIWI